MKTNDNSIYLQDHIMAWAHETRISTPEDLYKTESLPDFVETLLEMAGVFPEEEIDLDENY